MFWGDIWPVIVQHFIATLNNATPLLETRWKAEGILVHKKFSCETLKSKSELKIKQNFRILRNRFFPGQTPICPPPAHHLHLPRVQVGGHRGRHSKMDLPLLWLPLVLGRHMGLHGSGSWGSDSQRRGGNAAEDHYNLPEWNLSLLGSPTLSPASLLHTLTLFFS